MPIVAHRQDSVKAGLQMSNAIRAAVLGAHSQYIGSTVGDFIAALRKLGVRDDDVLGSIEVGIARYSTGWIHVERDKDGSLDVREVSK